MRVSQPLLSALLFLANVPIAYAESAAPWSPPALVPARPATPPRAEPAAPVVATIPTGATAQPDGQVTQRPPRARPARKACKKGTKRCKRHRAPKVDPRLLLASTQRARLLELAQPMAATGRSNDAARILASAAAVHTDPILYLAAAEAELADPHIDGDRLARAIGLTKEAQRLITAPIDLRITPGEGPQLTAEAQELSAYATRLQAQRRLQRRSTAELASGTTFLVLGATGVGVLVSGAVLSSRVDAAREAYTGQDAAYLAALTDGKERAGTLLAAGLVSGLVGAAIGIPLTIAGSRDRKRARGDAPERPSFRFAPGLAAVSIVGRF